jgi:hypothetical protein
MSQHPLSPKRSSRKSVHEARQTPKSSGQTYCSRASLIDRQKTEISSEICFSVSARNSSTARIHRSCAGVPGPIASLVQRASCSAPFSNMRAASASACAARIFGMTCTAKKIKNAAKAAHNVACTLSYSLLTLCLSSAFILRPENKLHRGVLAKNAPRVHQLPKTQMIHSSRR